jgi:putative phosphoesterase
VLVAVIADTHMTGGPRKLPPACVEQVARADLLLHAGDVMTYEALVEIEAIGPRVLGVLGNVDSAELAERLPPERVVELPGGVRIGMVHDAGPRQGRLARMRFRFKDADAVVFGHSHLPLHEADTDGFQIFNPGSPTERRSAPTHTMGIATVEDGRVHFELIAL